MKTRKRKTAPINNGSYYVIIGPRGVGHIRYFIEQQMKGEKNNDR